jgi:hypothetical protein
MLNELRELSICLEKAGIEPEDLHPNFKACPKGGLTYWVYVDEQGNISGIALVPFAQVPTVRKWERANGVSFPAFNVPPLLEAGTDDLKEQIKGLRKKIEKGSNVTADELLAAITGCKDQWGDSIIKKLTDCLTKPMAELSEYLGEASKRYESIGELCRRSKQIKADTFKQQLTDTLVHSIQSEPAADLIDTLFFYNGMAPKNFQVILELADRERFEYPANHQEVQRWMNTRFMAAASKNDRSDLDAFGCNASGKDEKFPPVRLPVLGNVILRAMNQESPCQTRYGMIDHYSFPAGDAARKGMKSALEWLGKEERKGKTWCDLSRRMERPMLFFAYPSQIPVNLPELAGMMGDEVDDIAETHQGKFSALAEKVTVALRGRTKETVNSEIRVFVLVKMDKARTKVVASSRYSSEHVIGSAQLWQEGSQNGPTIKIRSFGKNKGNTTVWIETLIPFPAEVVWCLNTVWSRQGTRAEGAHGFSVNDALSLLLGEGQELHQVATRALSAVLRNSFPLLMALGQANVQGLVHMIDKKYTKKYEKQKLLIPSIISLILHKLGHTKGEIMTSSAFLVGRLLNLADSLHLEYCKGPRKGSVPPQLVGNALMATALETPEKALSMLSQRILPYQAWARTVKEGDRVGLVKTFLKQLGEVSEQLKEAPLPQRSSDTDKAQMLLGYLGRVESENN